MSHTPLATSSTSVSNIMPMGVAGAFYPAARDQLENLLKQCYAQSARPWARPYKAMIVPHAGLAFSGPVAASAFSALKQHSKDIERIIILAPSHHHTFEGVALPSVSAFDTPFGSIPVATSSVIAALAKEGARILDKVFQGEHAIEVELPFIQQLMPHVRVVPMIVGQISPKNLDAILDSVWGGPETLILISSDLSHYMSAENAYRKDFETCALIDNLAEQKISSDRACGHQPLRALLRQAARLDLRPVRLDLRHSGQITGRNDKVVGYCAYGFEPARSARLSDPLREDLIKAMQATLRYGLTKNKPPQISLPTFAQPLHTHLASFITLEKQGQLRGCIGSYVPYRPLILDVVENTFKAAFADPRFKPLQADEFNDLELSVSILSHPRRVPSANLADLLASLQPDRDGLILRQEKKQALFLPKVWDSIPKPEQFIAALLQKAGIAANSWPDNLQAWTFGTEIIDAGLKKHTA
jgi:AmmeMemoRadiSam system protein B/AmmeMemoRadiSam system protein A